MLTGHRVRGFSLIEILVVVVIIAIVSAIALLSLGLLGDDRELQTEGRRLASLVEVAQDEATMQGREFGLEFTVDAYRFVEYDPYNSRWVELFGDELLRIRRLPEGVEFDLYLEGQRVALDFEPADIEEPDNDSMVQDAVQNYAPHILIYSSGDVTPFELALMRRSSQQSLVLEGDFAGGIEIASAED
ncbi:MAG TPA: type II secretion system minor pseudopilin GspH [Woeseiaceae bacterium]|jgi:general secretion pathway protein H|nr:type II secretion system minor pseudopilin GspH [Woeseiaceae bacterium]